MKHGDIVSIPSRSSFAFAKRYVRGVVLNVTAADIRAGVNTRRPGLHVFGGYWYGKDPLSIHSYGKIHPPIGRVIGRARSHSQIVYLGI